MARIGILTGGGDCPGLNAVIRAIVRRGTDAHGHEFFGFTYGWAGVLAGEGRELDLEATRGILPRGGTILGTSRTNPFEDGGAGVDGVRAGMERGGRRHADPDRRRGHAGRRRPAGRGGHSRGRRPEDDRQRPRRDGLHVRLPDRRADRDRRDRPPPHDRRVAQPGDRRRGDGSPRGLDRRLLGDGRAAPTRSSSPSGPSTSTRSARICGAATTAAAASRSSSSAREPTPSASSAARRGRVRPTPSDTCGSAASRSTLEGAIEERTGYECRE